MPCIGHSCHNITLKDTGTVYVICTCLPNVFLTMALLTFCPCHFTEAKYSMCVVCCVWFGAGIARRGGGGVSNWFVYRTPSPPPTWEYKSEAIAQIFYSSFSDMLLPEIFPRNCNRDLHKWARWVRYLKNTVQTSRYTVPLTMDQMGRNVEKNEALKCRDPVHLKRLCHEIFYLYFCVKPCLC